MLLLGFGLQTLQDDKPHVAQGILLGRCPAEELPSPLDILLALAPEALDPAKLTYGFQGKNTRMRMWVILLRKQALKKLKPLLGILFKPVQTAQKGVGKPAACDVPEEDVDAVFKLGVMVRIAESLDRSMSGVIKTITCDVLGDSVIMKTEAEGDCSLEIKDAMQAGANFRKAYKKNLQIL